MTDLARIERVDLRKAWPNEARDFTPWLAENIGELGAALGVDLELREEEAPVGGYSLDILARDLNGERPVIIENQLESTDHTHLGQLLTYAAGFDANMVVWLTREFRDEHRQALDWLNQRTDEQTQFFGVVVELWKIGNSLPAPHFKVEAAPNDWRKRNIRNDRSLEVSERDERYIRFFQPLIDTLREKYKLTTARKVSKTPWRFYFSTGYGQGIRYGTVLTRAEARVEMYIDDMDGDWNIELLESLEERQAEIESGVGEQLDWRRLEGYRACLIVAVRPGSIQDDDETLNEIREWMIDRLLRFKSVFDPHLKELVGRKVKFTDQDRVDIYTRYKAGASAEQLALDADRTVSSIRSIIQKGESLGW